MAFSHQLQRVIDLVGHQATIRLVRQYGGRNYQVPPMRTLHDLHPLVVLVGMASAEALVREFEDSNLTLPHEVNALLQIRNDHILQRYESGDSISSIASDLSVDRKLVQRILDTFQARGKTRRAVMSD